MMTLDEQIDRMKTRKDFVIFVQALRKDLIQNPEIWHNTDLPSFLEALAAWVADTDDCYFDQKNSTPENVPWNIFARILMGASVYS